VNKEAQKNKWATHLEDIHSRFRAVHPAPLNWTMPFVPWCGNGYWESNPRILYVGKSVGCLNDEDEEPKLWKTKLEDWNMSPNVPDALKLTQDYVRKRVANLTAYRPEFWLVPMLVSGTFVSPQMNPHQLVESFAWTNLYKICNRSNEKKGGLPTKQDLEWQYSEGVSLLHQSALWLMDEIETLKPHLVILGISDEWPGVTEVLKIHVDTKDRLPMMLNDSQVVDLKLSYRPKGIWVTYHFSRWMGSKRNGAHGRLLLEMRKALES
jgi:hypothetical protein